ncbi:hypothetical protein FKW77_006744 [Venturia effusa]|uniref:Uncharacterized protein n=1 Tax=Venturia effusa TaxID=50376 RepID=A0A517LQD8_9PEZI|nr:hypothetical protein FKW77_006744 [Venturia effusa]
MDPKSAPNNSGSLLPDPRSEKTGSDEGASIMGQILQTADDGISLFTLRRQPCATAGKRLLRDDIEQDHGSDKDVEETGINRPRPTQRSHRSVGGVRPAPTPTDTTFPIFEDDTEIIDPQTVESSFGTSQCFAQPYRGVLPQERRRPSTNTSQTLGLGVDHDDELLPPPNALLYPDQQKQNAATQPSAPPTRQQVLAFLRSEIDIFNYKKQHGSTFPEELTRKSTRQRTNTSKTMNRSIPFVPFTAPALLAKLKKSGQYDDAPRSLADSVVEKVAKMDGTDEREPLKNREVAWLERTSDLPSPGQKERNLVSPIRIPSLKPGRSSTRLQSPARRGSVIQVATCSITQREGLSSSFAHTISIPRITPPTILDLSRNATVHGSSQTRINLTTILQTHLDAFPAIYALYPTLRSRPWESLEFRSRLSPIEWNGRIRLKLDIFIATMDWAYLNKVAGLVRDDFLKLVKDVINRSVVGGTTSCLAAQAETAVSVVVQTLRVERIIDAIHAKFEEKQHGQGERREVIPSLVKSASSPATGDMFEVQSFERGGQYATKCINEDIAHHSSGPAMNSERAYEPADRQDRRKDGGMSDEVRHSRLAELRGLAETTCLLTWLWFLEAVPEDVLSSIDVASIERVFREKGDAAVVPSGAVVIVRQ